MNKDLLLPAGTHVRPGVPMTMAVDTVVLDIDGVLLDVRASFREVVRLVVPELQRLAGARDPWVPTRDDISALKQAGGFNDDIDLSAALGAIALGGRGGQFQRVALGIERQGGGLTALAAVAPELPPVDMGLVLRLFNEHYWGWDGFRRRFGEEPRHIAAGAVGLERTERPLATGDVLHRLHAAGVAHVAVITGRNAMEFEAAIQRLGWKRQDLALAVTVELARKPDPACLDLVIAAVGSRSLVYIGDTRDDWELVRRYREERLAGVDVRGVIVASGGQVIHYRHLGVDACVKRTDDALLLVERWRENSTPRHGFLSGLRRSRAASR